MTRDSQGRAQVWLVGPGNKAVARTVTAERTLGADWVVTAGLRGGDRVVVRNVSAVRPDAVVRPTVTTLAAPAREG